MATTKLWHIQGRLKDLVDYVENPEKTVKPGLQDFFNVFSYTQNPDKTAGGQFVTAINCQKDIALQQMILTKQRHGKEDGILRGTATRASSREKSRRNSATLWGWNWQGRCGGIGFRLLLPPIWTRSICITTFASTLCLSKMAASTISPRKS